MADPVQSHRGSYAAALLICVALALFCLAYPIYVIRPFRMQGSRELAAALTVMRIRGVISVVVAVVAILAAIRYWTLRPRIWKRVAAVFAASAACLFAVLCRVNIYELMFHPNSRPGFIAADQSKLDRDEKVIAVRLQSSRAYPIRSISYHHVINDVVDSVPIVATY